MTEQRIKSLQKILETDTAAIITSNENRFYLTGFPSSAGAVVVTPQNSVLLIDFRYFEKAKAVVKNMSVKLCEHLYNDITKILKSDKINNVILESDSITLSQFSAFKKGLKNYNILNSPILSQTLNNLRQIKSKSEIELIKKAQSITDMGFEHILNYIRIGRTEKEIALELEFFMRKNGADGIAFDTIAVSGKNSSLPHGVPSDKPLENGDFLTMDFGAKYNGYCSDMTRTVAIGSITERQSLVYDTVLTAQEEALNEISSGKKCCDIDRIARDIINKVGFEGTFGHGLGHSLGIEIHESPACNTKDETPLTAGMIMTVEPGIYLENEFGIRIEDMVLIKENETENLTKSPKELIII